MRIKNGLLHLRQPCFQTKNIELLQVLANAVRPYGNSYRGFTITKPKTKTLVGAISDRQHLLQLHTYKQIRTASV